MRRWRLLRARRFLPHFYSVLERWGLCHADLRLRLQKLRPRVRDAGPLVGYSGLPGLRQRRPDKAAFADRLACQGRRKQRCAELPKRHMLRQLPSHEGVIANPTADEVFYVMSRMASHGKKGGRYCGSQGMSKIFELAPMALAAWRPEKIAFAWRAFPGLNSDLKNKSENCDPKRRTGKKADNPCDRSQYRMRPIRLAA